MDTLLKTLGDRLSNFFTRSVAPSSFFFVLLFFIDYFFYNEKIFDEVFIILDEINQLNSILLYIVLVVVFLAYGYINQVFSQILDNRIKENYELSDLASEYKYIEEYQNLRNKVKERAKEEYKLIFDSIDFNDYNAYQVLGKNFKQKAIFMLMKLRLFILYI